MVIAVAVRNVCLLVCDLIVQSLYHCGSFAKCYDDVGTVPVVPREKGVSDAQLSCQLGRGERIQASSFRRQ